MFKKIIVMFSMLVAFSTVASETDISYNAFQASYLSAEVEDEYLKGFGVLGSIDLGRSVFVYAEYASLSGDMEIYNSPSIDGSGSYSVDIETTAFAVGPGIHTALSDNVDILASVAIVGSSVNIDNGSYDAHASGYGVNAGLRAKSKDEVELSFMLAFVDIEDESDTSITIGARYFIVPTVSLGAEYTHVDDSSMYGINLRVDLVPWIK